MFYLVILSIDDIDFEIKVIQYIVNINYKVIKFFQMNIFVFDFSILYCNITVYQKC